MQEQKNWLSIFIVGIVIIILIIIGFIFGKKLNFSTKETVNNPVATTTRPVVDTGGKISTELPKDLIKQAEIKQVTESYSTTDAQGKKQYTFRYVSQKSLAENSLYYKDYLSKNSWHLTSATSTAEFASITSIKNQTEKMFITINYYASDGVSVDVTYIK